MKWIGRATSVFFGMSVALIIAVVPIVLWLKSEIDHLTHNVNAIADTTEDIAFGVGVTLEDVPEGLSPLTPRGVTLRATSVDLSQDALLTQQWLARALPEDEYQSFLSSGRINMMRGVRINNNRFIFMSAEALRQFSAKERLALRKLELAGGPSLFLMNGDTTPTPGATERVFAEHTQPALSR